MLFNTILHAQNAPTNFFSKELMLGTTEHNLPLYVIAKSDENIIPQILIDINSFMNIMYIWTLK